VSLFLLDGSNLKITISGSATKLQKIFLGEMIFPDDFSYKDVALINPHLSYLLALDKTLNYHFRKAHGGENYDFDSIQSEIKHNSPKINRSKLK
jgi:hypothetical protein